MHHRLGVETAARQARPSYIASTCELTADAYYAKWTVRFDRFNKVSAVQHIIGVAPTNVVDRHHTKAPGSRRIRCADLAVQNCRLSIAPQPQSGLLSVRPPTTYSCSLRFDVMRLFTKAVTSFCGSLDAVAACRKS